MIHSILVAISLIASLFPAAQKADGAKKPSAEGLIATLSSMLKQQPSSGKKADFGPWSAFGDKAMDLCFAMKSEHTKQVLELVDQAQRVSTEAKELVLLALSVHGDEKLTIGMYLDIVKRINPSAGDEFETMAFAYTSRNLTGAAISVVMRSFQPSAVDYRIGILKDPKAHPGLRNLAFVSLPGNGGEAGLAAVRSIRSNKPDSTRLVNGTLVDSKPNDDSQQVLNAAAEGLLKFIRPSNVQIVYLPDGVLPFQFTGLQCKVIIGDPEVIDNSRLSIEYTYPREDFDGHAFKTKPAKGVILWEEGHKRAKVVVMGGLDQAGYNVELRKIGGEWFVTNLRMAWVE